MRPPKARLAGEPFHDLDAEVMENLTAVLRCAPTKGFEERLLGEHHGLLYDRERVRASRSKRTCVGFARGREAIAGVGRRRPRRGLRSYGRPLKICCKRLRGSWPVVRA